MIFLLKHFHNVTGLAAFICWLVAAGKSDCDVTANITTLIITGAILMIPSLIHMVVPERGERQ